MDTSGWTYQGLYDFRNDNGTDLAADDGLTQYWNGASGVLSVGPASGSVTQGGVSILQTDNEFDKIVFSYNSTGTTGNEYLKFSLGSSPVPEPSSALFLSLGGLGLLARRTRS